VSQHSRALFNKFKPEGIGISNDTLKRGTTSVDVQSIHRKLSQRFPSLRKSKPASTAAHPSASEHHLNPYTDADFDAAVNLVTEWKCLSFQSNQQLNVRRLQAHQLMVNRWSKVQWVAD